MGVASRVRSRQGDDLSIWVTASHGVWNLMETKMALKRQHFIECKIQPPTTRCATIVKTIIDQDLVLIVASNVKTEVLQRYLFPENSWLGITARDTNRLGIIWESCIDCGIQRENRSSTTLFIP